MNLKTRRAINFWWAFGSIILVAVICVAGWFAFGKAEWFIYFMISIILSFSVFWGFYLAFTSFKKNKYPFLTYIPEYNPSRSLITKITTSKFLWIWLLPLIAAIISPALFLIIQGSLLPESISWKPIVAYVISAFIVIINNFIYAIAVNKQLGGEENSSEFTMKLD